MLYIYICMYIQMYIHAHLHFCDMESDLMTPSRKHTKRLRKRVGKPEKHDLQIVDHLTCINLLE
jgi:hypothetical protein